MPDGRDSDSELANVYYNKFIPLDDGEASMATGV